MIAPNFAWLNPRPTNQFFARAIKWRMTRGTGGGNIDTWNHNGLSANLTNRPGIQLEKVAIFPAVFPAFLRRHFRHRDAMKFPWCQNIIGNII